MHPLFFWKRKNSVWCLLFTHTICLFWFILGVFRKLALLGTFIKAPRQFCHLSVFYAVRQCGTGWLQLLGMRTCPSHRQLWEPGGMAGGLQLPLLHHLYEQKVRGCPMSLSREPGITDGKRRLKAAVI